LDFGIGKNALISKTLECLKYHGKQIMVIFVIVIA